MKRLLCVISILTLCDVCMAQDKGFSTLFEITGIPDSTRFIVRIHDGDNFRDWRYDTIYMVNGKAELQDISKAKDPVRVYVYSDFGIISTFVQNEHTELISGKKADIEKETLRYEGATWSEDIMSYNRELGTLKSELQEKGRDFGSITDEYAYDKDVPELDRSVKYYDKFYANDEYVSKSESLWEHSKDSDIRFM